MSASFFRFGSRSRVDVGDPTSRVTAALLVLSSAPAWGAGGAPGPEGGAAAPPRRSTEPPRAVATFDPAVRPAGGHVCRDCAPGGGRPCHPSHGHDRGCRDGVCVPSCPVRPVTFGFYGTQWRRWPGQGVVPASYDTAATPAVPPRSAPPTADQESPRVKAGDSGGSPTDIPSRPRSRAGGPAELPEPSAPEPSEVVPDVVNPPRAPEPAPLPESPPAARPRGPSAPDAKPAPKPAVEEENLFDEAAVQVRRRILAAAGAGGPRPRPPDVLRPVALEDGPGRDGATAPGQHVRRVPFDSQADQERPLR